MGGQPESRSRARLLTSYVPLALAALLASAACSPTGRSRTTDRPRLIPLDSVILQEVDTALLADLGPYATVDDDGALWVTEQQSSRVLRFQPSGRLAMVLGRRGRGPGEFGYVGPVILVTDSLVLVEANFRGQIQAFHRTSGSYLGSIRFSGVNITSAAATPSHLIWGNLQWSADRSVMLMPRSPLPRGDRGEVSPFRSTLHALPRQYRTYPELERFYLVPLTAWRDTMVVTFAAVNWLVRSTIDGAAMDTAYIPIQRRRGVTPSALEIFGALPLDFERAYRAISLTYALWRLPDGRIVVWHQDGTVKPADQSRLEIEARAFVSVLSPDFRSACVDAEVPPPSGGRPRLAMRADTLYSLDQLLDTAAPTGLRTVVRRYLVSTDGCTWLPTDRRPD